MRCPLRLRPAVIILTLALAVVLPRQAARAQESVSLVAGCNNVALPFASGTSIRVVAGQIQPPGALQSIFRYDAATSRWLAFSPDTPESLNDYLMVGARLEPVFICMDGPGTLTGIAAIATAPTPAPAPAPPPAPATPAAVGRGVISAPSSIKRGESAEVIIGVAPNIACTGGINIPADSTFRFVPFSQGSSPTGVLVIRFDVLETDDPSFAYLAIRCADDTIFRLSFRIT